MRKHVLLFAMVALVLLYVPVLAQEREFVEDFDNPELPSWDHPPAADSPQTDEGNAEVLPVSEWNWVRTGGPMGGLGYDVRMHPDNPDLMYVTDAFAGVFISEDGGQHWFPSNEGLTPIGGPSGDAIPVFSLTIDPNDPEIIWIGMQNVSGIYRSQDGGQSWEARMNGVVETDHISFRGFTVEPGNSDVVYAMAELSSWAWAGEGRSGIEFDMTAGVVYKTTDGGLNWTAVWRGDNLARYLWIDPRDTQVLYLSTGIFDREAANSDPSTGNTGGVGILKSTDGGQTWQSANNGLGNLFVGTLFMHPENPDILLAGTGMNVAHTDAGVYLTTDGAQSWTKVLDEWIQSVEFSTSNPNIAYAGSSWWIARSEDGGHTWEQVSGTIDGWGPPGVRAGFPIDFQVDPRDPDRIFANNYGGGNFLSQDGGRTWSNASSGYTGAQVRDVAVDPQQPGRIFAAARSGGFVSHDGGATWIGLSFPPAWNLEWNAIAVDPSNPTHLIASDNWVGTIYYSETSGLDWRPAARRLPEQTGVRIIRFAPSNPSIAYIGVSGFFSAGGFNIQANGGGIYRSENGGRGWNQVGADTIGTANVASLDIHPENPDIVLAATTNQGLLRTLDSGQTWETIQGSWPADQSLLSVAFNPHNPEQIFVGLEFGGVYISQDGGDTWQMVAAGIPPEVQVTSFAFNPVDPGNIFLGARGSGCYLSTDGGQNWRQFNEGLTMRSINGLVFTTDGMHLYAATEGGGVFRLDLNGQPPADAPVVRQDAEAGSTDPSGDSEAEAGEEGDAQGEGGLQLPCIGGSAPAFLAVGLVVVSLTRRKSRSAVLK